MPGATAKHFLESRGCGSGLPEGQGGEPVVPSRARSGRRLATSRSTMVNLEAISTEESRIIACHISLAGHPAGDNGCSAITETAREPWV